MKYNVAILTALVAAMATGPSYAQDTADGVAPEVNTVLTVEFFGLSDAANAALASKANGTPVIADDWMITAANPLAVEAGAAVLRDEGTAADAMVAVQAVLGLVEPQSSGLGGGAFLVWYDAASGELTTLDGRETAPMAVTPTVKTRMANHSSSLTRLSGACLLVLPERLA